MSHKRLEIAVIGSGIAGIAAAIRLAIKGHEVTVFEAHATPGGKLNQISTSGYRFDAGPSLLTLPSLIDELFEIAGENPEDHFQYEQLDTNCHYFFEDNTAIKAYSDQTKLIHELAAKTGESPDAIVRHLRHSQMLFENLSGLFMFRSLNDPGTYFSKQALKAYLKIPQFGFFKTMNRANEQRFDSPKLIQLFNRYATYNGSDPYQTPATMNIIPHLEMSIGAYFPRGGMYSITSALVKLAERKGVKFRFKTRVNRIILNGKKAIGIATKSDEERFDKVISNMDIVNSYKHLLPDITPPKFLLNQPKSSSALIFYWGVKRQFDQLDVHNIFFSEDYKKEFDHIFQKGNLCNDPTIYVNITSKKNTSDAPSGCENWFVMINTPNNQGQNWDELIAQSRKVILEKLSRNLKTNISELIEVEEILDPRQIESKTSSSLGALYGNSSNNLFAAFLRHANKSARIKNLFFCGGSVHPGGGIPMCLSSAKILSEHFP
ncbi:MAG: 1-hydroxycarotenoid 3,4-desaturase CrtD, partial [Cyclobacteriaceae bacterium]